MGWRSRSVRGLAYRYGLTRNKTFDAVIEGKIKCLCMIDRDLYSKQPAKGGYHRNLPLTLKN